MSTNSASSASAAINIGPRTQFAERSHRSPVSAAPAITSHKAASVQQIAPGDALRAAWTSSNTRDDDTLPLDGFLREVYREQRRVERSGAALSLVVFHVSDKSLVHPLRADRLLEVVHSTKRETDIVGHLNDDVIAVLCPDTGEVGAKCFAEKVAARSDASHYSPLVSTYPDNLLKDIARGAPTRPSTTSAILAADSYKLARAYTLKRYLDIACAFIAISILAPVMLTAAALIALTSRGPIIFKQVRLGKGGVPFTFYKFRSMVIDGDDTVHRKFVANLIKGNAAQDPANKDDRAQYKLQADPRITPIGRFIRKTSIDELPQLFNVLKGDMSLVGPRPAIPYETSHYQSWHLRRILTVTPGITGLWQVDGRSRVTFNDMVRMDLRYIRDCCLATDLKILLKTVLVVLRGDGAR